MYEISVYSFFICSTFVYALLLSLILEALCFDALFTRQRVIQLIDSDEITGT